MKKKNLLNPSLLVLAGLLMSAGLAGCDQKKDAAASASNALALPLTTGPAAAIVPAPSVDLLPAASPVRIAQVASQSDDYAYVDRAYEMSSAIGQAPPDYGFDYEGVHPWVWRSSSGDVRLVEPVDGGYRYYYYQPGATEPYLVRDPQYSYGFSDGQLVSVYDNEGRLLSPGDIDQRVDDAGRYLARATALYEASVQSERRSVNAANWAEQRAELAAARTRWEAEQSQQQAWRACHAQHEAEEQAYWQGERDQRDQSARSFDNWSGRGFNGPPPPPISYARNNNQVVPAQGAGSIVGGRGNSRDGGQPAQLPAGIGHQGVAARQTQPQTALDQARIQHQAQADAQAKAAAAQQAQSKAAAASAAQALQQKTHADAARAQQQAQADAARQAQAKAARPAQAASLAHKPSGTSQPLPTQPTQERTDAHRAAAKKAFDNAHPHDDASRKQPV
jgi:hypothetical protein